MTSSVITAIVNYIGLAAFAFSGALMAVHKQFDVVGMLVLATITTLGGGVIRDVLIGDTPPEALTHLWWLVVPTVATGLAFFFHPQITRLRGAITLFDAVGLGVFAANGTAKALSFGLGAVASIGLGVVTGIGGGILRDLLAGETPAVLRRDSQLYAIPAVLGCIGFAIAHAAGMSQGWNVFAAAVFTSGLRLLALWRRWTGPVPHALYR
jgi:uncharacterized membrane protein YeiH